MAQSWRWTFCIQLSSKLLASGCRRQHKYGPCQQIYARALSQNLLFSGTQISLSSLVATLLLQKLRPLDVQQAFQGTVPVPELYRWHVDDEGYVFIYMQLIEGQALLDQWDDLHSIDKEVMRNQLYEIIRSLRQLSQKSGKYIGTP